MRRHAPVPYGTRPYGDVPVNGAESLVRTFVDAGVEVCFANPGTSEMHFVAALDRVGGIRCVLGLFEGVVTGAAEGYARMSGKPGVTLLHLGPGLGNGIANLHNARKAGSPIVNVVGEHASWHIAHDAPLTADIEGLARPVSHWVGTARDAASVAADGAAALAAARVPPGQVATLILPANTAWEAAGPAAVTPPAEAPAAVDAARIETVAEVLRSGEPVAIVLGGHCLREEALEHASRVARSSGATLLCETFKARLQRGAGRVAVREVPYTVEAALALLAPFRHVVTVGAKAPVAFFAYPDKPSALYPPEATTHSLASDAEDGVAALRALAETLGADALEPERQAPELPPPPADGALDPGTIAALLAHHIPEQAIVVDEALTVGRDFLAATRGAAPHDWLEVCGGSIGGGFPLATGAAVACPDRQVVCLEGDGSAMYTVQALWTQAREALDVTTLVFANRRYAILEHELDNVQADSGEIARRMLSLEDPVLDWIALARGMGVEAVRVETVAELDEALARGLSTRSPFLIEVVV